MSSTAIQDLTAEIQAYFATLANCESFTEGDGQYLTLEEIQAIGSKGLDLIDALSSSLGAQ